MGNFSEYHVTIGERAYVAIVSSRGSVVRGEGPLDRFVGHRIEDLTRACRRRGYRVTIHEASSHRSPGSGPTASS
jgi:hypothetical protein